MKAVTVFIPMTPGDAFGARFAEAIAEAESNWLQLVTREPILLRIALSINEQGSAYAAVIVYGAPGEADGW